MLQRGGILQGTRDMTSTERSSIVETGLGNFLRVPAPGVKAGQKPAYARPYLRRRLLPEVLDQGESQPLHLFHGARRGSQSASVNAPSSSADALTTLISTTTRHKVLWEAFGTA